jgi:lipopolysaccharide export system permease protein
VSILQRYLTAGLIWITLAALLVLVALFSFFSIIDQLEATGRGNYGITQALSYVLLTTPRLAYEIFPIAAVIGSMGTLGMLARNSELAVIRTSGVSRLDLALLLAKSGFLLVVLAVVIGEFVAPVSEELAQQQRSMAMSEQILSGNKHGFWVRDGNSYINIRKVLPDNKVEDLYIYEFDDAHRLRNSIFAQRASFTDGQWLLHDISQTSITAETATTVRLEAAIWESQLDPGMFNFVSIEPQRLTFRGLYQYIKYLGLNAQDTSRYEQALWAKLIKPFSIVAMILLAIPLVQTHARYTLVARQVFVGAFAGIMFHICNQISGHLGIVYNFPPLLSVAAPTVMLSGFIFFSLLKRP